MTGVTTYTPGHPMFAAIAAQITPIHRVQNSSGRKVSLWADQAPATYHKRKGEQDKL